MRICTLHITHSLPTFTCMATSEVWKHCISCCFVQHLHSDNYAETHVVSCLCAPTNIRLDNTVCCLMMLHCIAMKVGPCSTYLLDHPEFFFAWAFCSVTGKEKKTIPKKWTSVEVTPNLREKMCKQFGCVHYTQFSFQSPLAVLHMCCSRDLGHGSPWWWLLLVAKSLFQ